MTQTIAFASPQGGAGQTTLIANLATLLTLRQVPCLAVDLCISNCLGTHLGQEVPSAQGWVNAIQPHQWWAENALVNSLDVAYLSYGEHTIDHYWQLQQVMLSNPHWLKDQIAALELSHTNYVLLDAPLWPSGLAQQAMQAADLVVVCIEVSHKSCHSEPLIRWMMAQYERDTDFAVLLTGYDPRLNSHISAMQTLQHQWADLLVPYTLHQDENIPKALSQYHCASAIYPHAQAVHDMQGIGNWLLSQYPPTSVVGV